MSLGLILKLGFLVVLLVVVAVAWLVLKIKGGLTKLITDATMAGQPDTIHLDRDWHDREAVARKVREYRRRRRRHRRGMRGRNRDPRSGRARKSNFFGPAYIFPALGAPYIDRGSKAEREEGGRGPPSSRLDKPS